MKAADPASLARLRFLAETADAERRHLATTDGRLFAEPFTPDRARRLADDIDLAERVDAFVSRFGRLQDTLGDKLLPTLLAQLAEPLGSAIDNLARAERLGLVASADLWLQARRLRNRMVHEYVRDPAELAAALQAGHGFVPLLGQAAEALVGEVRRRFGTG